jgi:hypothetical protein
MTSWSTATLRHPIMKLGRERSLVAERALSLATYTESVKPTLVRVWQQKQGFL